MVKNVQKKLQKHKMSNSKKIIILLVIVLVIILLVFTYITYNTYQQKQEVTTTKKVETTFSPVEKPPPLLADTTKKENKNSIVAPNKKEVSLKNTSIVIHFNAIPNLELPQLLQNEEMITHTGFQLVYSETHEQSKWVCYQFTKAETNKIANRSDNFREDVKIKTHSANDNDYKGSGYDRGHLAPAGDMSWSGEAMSCSFYYSNMSPQTPSFNRGIWKKLEEQVRDWVAIYDTLYIVTGPVLTDKLPTIGVNQVSVPSYYYKVILDAKKERKESIGFVMPNKKSNLPLQHYVVSVDSVEKLTGIDFFYQLPNEIENQIEKKVCVSCWKW